MQIVLFGMISRTDEFRVHWLPLLIATIGIGLSVTGLPFYSAGVFVGPLHEAFGWSRAEIASAHLALFLSVGIASPVAGLMIDRLGIRAIVLFSMMSMAVGFLLLSFLQGSLIMYVAVAVGMGVLGSGASAIAFTRVVTKRFTRARGLALGICLMGSGIVATIAPPSLEAIISAIGWRSAYRFLALAMLFGMPLMLLLDGPARMAAIAVRSAASSDRVLTRPRFWILLLSINLTAFGSVGVSYHLVPLLTDLTRSAATAAQYASLLGFAVVISRPLAGYALDRIYAPIVAAGLSLLGAAACLMLDYGTGRVTLLISVFLVGSVLGAEFDVTAYLTSRYFKPASYGRVYGFIYGGSVIISGISPYVVGKLFDMRGNYGSALLAMAAACAASSLLILFLGPYPVDTSEQMVAEPL